tara:strand:- start:588 stop:1355 length:768 start_codon:yes stop_codon:yes gene_type:complete
MNIFERTWKMIQKNPMAAFAAFEGLSFLGGAIFPESSRGLTDRLRFNDRTAPVQGPLPARGPAPKNYGQLTGGSRSLGSRSVARSGIFGNTSGALYDIQKGIGSFLAAPIDIGRRFSPWAESGNVGYEYLTGQSGAGWKDVKNAIRSDLGLQEGGLDGIVGESLGFLDSSGAGGGGGNPRGRQRTKLTHKKAPGYGSQVERMRQARQTQGYGPNQLRAIALAFNDSNLKQINRDTANVKTNKQTINLQSQLRQLS